MDEPDTTTPPEGILAPWERPMAPSLFTLEETARRLGHYTWAEMRTFEVVGGWTSSIDEPGIKARLAIHANQHAWHAELWDRRFPELRDMDPGDFVKPVNGSLVAFFDALAASEVTADRVVGLGRVLLPHLVATYTFHRNRASEISDGPVIRSLGFVLADDKDQLADTALMLGTLLDTHDDIERGAKHQVQLESLLADAGGIIGRETPA